MTARSPAAVCAVVLNYAHPADTLSAIDALRRSTHPCRIIAVDNGPPPGATERLRDLLDPDVVLIESRDNVGFGAGCNSGIVTALDQGADFVWLVNPDVVVAEDALAFLLQAAGSDPEAGVFGPRIHHGGTEPKRIWFDGGRVDWSRGGATRHFGSGQTDADRPQLEPFRVDYVTGAAMLFDARMLREVGLLPEDYFMYYEETDLCLRARRAGWHSVVVPRARAEHFRRSTAGDLPRPYFIYYTVRNRIHFGTRHSDFTADAIVADMADFIDHWRGQVESRAPGWLAEFDRLVGLAIADARAGVVGRRADIEHVAHPS